MSETGNRRGSLRRKPASSAGVGKAAAVESVDKPAKRTRKYVEPDAGIVVPGYGSTAQIRALADRLMVLSDVPEEERSEALPAAMRAAQMCVLYGFMPGQQVNLFLDGKQWVADAGLRAWTESANRLARSLRFTWLLDESELVDAEVREACERAGREYSPGDRAWICRVIRSDKLALAEKMGAEYDPPYVTGFWNRKAREVRDVESSESFWQADPVYKGRDASYTARLRAQKAAMMVEFSLMGDERKQLSDESAVAKAMAHVEAEIREVEDRRRRADQGDVLFVKKDVQYEDDGDVLWA